MPLSPRRMRNNNGGIYGECNPQHVSGTKSFKTVFKLSQSGQKQQLLQQQSFTESTKHMGVNLTRSQ